MLEIVVQPGGAYQVGDLPNGQGKVLRITMPEGLVIVIPMDTALAANIAKALAGASISVPDPMTAMQILKKSQ